MFNWSFNYTIMEIDTELFDLIPAIMLSRSHVVLIGIWPKLQVKPNMWFCCEIQHEKNLTKCAQKSERKRNFTNNRAKINKERINVRFIIETFFLIMMISFPFTMIHFTVLRSFWFVRSCCLMHVCMWVVYISMLWYDFTQ